MSNDDDYRKQATDAQQMADRSIRPLDKAAWLRIAQSWLRLIRKPRRTEAEGFQDHVQAKGTGQKDSDSSH